MPLNSSLVLPHSSFPEIFHWKSCALSQFHKCIIKLSKQVQFTWGFKSAVCNICGCIAVICNDFEWNGLLNMAWFYFLAACILRAHWQKLQFRVRAVLKLLYSEWMSEWARERDKNRQIVEAAVFRDSDYLYLLAAWAKRLLIDLNVSVHDSKQTRWDSM